MLLCCKKQHTLHVSDSVQFSKTYFLTFIFILLFRCLQHFHLVTLYNVSLLQENDFSQPFKRLNAGSYSSEVSCISRGLIGRGAALPAQGLQGLPAADNTYFV